MTAPQRKEYFLKIYREDFEKASARGMVPERTGHWLPADLMCSKDKDSGACPLPENCKGDIYYSPHQADYAHPDIDERVNNSNSGTQTPFQHQGAGSPVDPQ